MILLGFMLGGFDHMAAPVPIRRADQGLEWFVFLVIAASGVTLGIYAPSWTKLSVGAFIVGVLLNALLLIRVAIATGNTRRLHLALIGSVPAGAYDAIMIFVIAAAVRWATHLLSRSIPLGYFLLLQGATVAIVFMISLNEFLKGAKKEQIDIVLVLVWVCLLVVAFVAFGWQACIITLLLSFVFGAHLRPICVRLAAWFLSGDSGAFRRHVGLPPHRLGAISRRLGKRLSPHQMAEEILFGRGRLEKAEEALLDYCQNDPGVQEVMAQFNVSRDKLKEVYHTLVGAGAGQWAGGHWVAASAIAYPHTLRYVLSHLANDPKIRLEIIYGLITHFEHGAPLE